MCRCLRALSYIYCADCWSCRPPELHLSVKPQMIKVNVVLEWIESTASEFHRRAVCVFLSIRHVLDAYLIVCGLISSDFPLSNRVLSRHVKQPGECPNNVVSSVKNKKPNNHLQVIFVEHVGRIALPAGRDEKLKKLVDSIKRAPLSTSLSGPELAFQLTPAEC